MKALTQFFIVFCAATCLFDLYAGAYGFALLQGAFCALNIYQYRRFYYANSRW